MDTLAREHLTLAVATAAALAVLGASVPEPAEAAPARGVHVGRAFFGMHDGSMLAYRRVTFGALRIWDAGATWREIETTPGHYDWSRLDALVSAAQQHHVKVMLVLGMTPSFYADRPTVPPTDLAPFTAYVRAAMLRYRSFAGRRGIESYQVWNEGNVTMSWTGTPHQLAEVTRAVDRVRDRTDPGATVVAPSFAMRLPAQRRWISAYQRQQVAGRPVWRHYDVNALSLYPRASYGSRAGGPEDAARLLRRVRSRMHAAGVPDGVPIWGTEVNYGVRTGDPGAGADPIPQPRQIAYVLRTYVLGAARGLARVYWYRYDWGRVAGGRTIGNTLLNDPDDWTRVSPAGRALLTARRWLTGRLVAERGHRRPCARDHRVTYTCTVRQGHHVRTILWNPTRTVRVRVRGAVSREDQRGRATSVNRGVITVRVGYRPVMLVRHR
jgi:hypothetical protein